MARASVNLELNNFSGGMITEGNPLSSPPNTYQLMQNWDLNADLSIQRRQGMKFLSPTHIDSAEAPALGNFLAYMTTWEASPSKTFTVFTVGTKIYFYDFSSDFTTPFFSVSIFSTFPSGEDYNVSFAQIKNYLVVAASNQANTYEVFSWNGSSIVAKSFPIKARDLWGEESMFANDERPTVAAYPTYNDLPITHRYNLQNMGWDSTQATAFSTAASVWPALSDLPWFFVNPSTGARDYSLYNDILNKGRAPFGSYVIEIGERDTTRESISGLNPLNNDESEVNAVDVEAFAGRIFWLISERSASFSIDTSPVLTGYVFFSQLVDNPLDVGKCHAENDPTDQFNNVVEATAGGFFQIDGLATPKALVATDDALIVFGRNGIWTVRGTAGGGVFTPSNYVVEKISNVGIDSSNSPVLTDGLIYFMSKSGVYVIAQNENGYYKVQNISDNTVKSIVDAVYNNSNEKFSILYPTFVNGGGIITPLFADLSNFGINQVKGRYDPIRRQITWMLLDFTETTVGQGLGSFTQVTPSLLNLSLVYDLKNGSFSIKSYPPRYTIQNPNPELESNLDPKPNFNFDGYLSDFVVVPITTAATAFEGPKTNQRKVYLNLAQGQNPNPANLYFNFSEESDSTFQDWNDSEGDSQQYLSTIVSSEVNVQDSQRRKQGDYLVVSQKKQDAIDIGGGDFDFGGDLKVYYGYDNPNNFNSRKAIETNPKSKINGPYQVYRERLSLGVPNPLDTSELVVTKNRIKGTGRAMQFRLETNEANKDARIYGLGFGMSANRRV